MQKLTMDTCIKLKKGKQKELILILKKNIDTTWREIGDIVGISGNYLSGDLKYEKVLLSKSLYRKICNLSSVNFDCYIEQELAKNWGQIKGGKKSKNRPRKPKMLVKNITKDLAEVFGIMLGDGSIYFNKKHKINQTVISGHLENNYEYMVNYVKPLFEKVFSREFKIRENKKMNEIQVYNQTKDVVFTLNNLGFPSGNKIKNNVGIPRWIFRSKEFLRMCIKGLIDTDGSVSSITGRNYTYIWFKSRIPKLRNDFTLAMNILGYKIAEWSSGKNRTPQTFIGNKRLIYKYYKEIGFNNIWHLKRFKAPIV